MPSKRPRTYHSPMRQQQADETRRRVVQAARQLILEKGYEDTTIDAIAEAAGVAPQTVYAAFKSKRGIVASLLDQARFGPDYQDLLQRAQATPDARSRLRFAASIARRIYDAERAEVDVLRGAGMVAPELAAMEQEKDARRFEAQGPLLEALSQEGDLHESLDVSTARDVLWTLTARELYRLLVVSRGWSPDRYEAWLIGQLESTLLSPSKPRRRPPSTKGS